MSNNQIPVVKFLFKEDLKSLNEALRLPPGYEVEDFATANDLATFLSTIPAGLVIASLKNKDDLVQIASYIKLGKKVAKDCAVKVVVINFSGDRTYEKAIAKLGILDLVEPSINTKALKFKLDFWMKSLTAQAKLTNKGETQQKVVKNTDQNKQAAGEKKPDPSIPVWNPPLELEDDIWLVKNEAEVKKILGKWLIRIVGPSPYVGQWAELKSGLWRYDIKESEKEMFVPNEGAWYFAGDQKPDFVWKENNWLISGESFDLFFKDSKQITSRLKSKDKILTICKNSLYAKTKEQIIIESFDKELVFKKEAEKMENLEGDSKGEKALGGNLEGKNKTDQIENANLEGKTKTGADKSGNLKGKIENQDAINNELLEQTANNKKEKTYWDGKNEYEEEGPADLDMTGEKARKDKNLAQKNDAEHEKFYKNHNEAKQFGKAELDKKERPESAYEDQQAKDMKGKSSTDDIPGYYDNNKKSKERSEKDSRPDEMSGKSETDRLKSHYGQKDVEKSEKEQRPDEMSGKSETDKLKSHYGQKDDADKTKNKNEKANKERQFSDEDSFSEESSDAMSGKSETDKLKSHYSKKESGRPEKELNEKDFGDKSEFEKARAQKEEKELKERKIAEREEREQKERKIAEREEKEQKERKRAEREEDEARGMSGKSSTDKIAGHYGGPKERESAEKDRKEAADDLAALKQLEKKYKDKSSQDADDLYDRPDKQRAEIDSENSDFERLGKDKSASKNRDQSADSDKDMYAREKKSRGDQSQSGFSDDDFEDSYSDDSEANKLSSQSASKNQKSKPGSHDEDHYDLAEARAARKNQNRDNSNDGKIADILPLNRAKTEKAKEATKVALDETGLDELTRDAKVLSTIVYKGKKINCELNDFFDDTIIFLTQEKSIEISAKVQLDLAFKFLEKDKKLNMEGSVTTVDGDGEGNNFVTIQLTKENTAAFDVFMRLYETRQSNVNEFIKKVKGL